MKTFCGTWFLFFSLGARALLAQAPQVVPHVFKDLELDGKVTKVEVAVGFVTTIRMPETVNSVVLGDPSGFQVEHSDKEPKLVFVKAISAKPAKTNLLISTTGGHQVSLLLVSPGEAGSSEPSSVDFVVSYQSPRDFLVAPSGFPFAMVGETVSLDAADHVSENEAQLSPECAGEPRKPRGDLQNPPLDSFLKEQESAPLPALYGEHIRYEPSEGDRVRTGVGRVVDGGDRVIILFSVVNPTKQPILLMPPQVQLAGRKTTGKFIHHKNWLSAEQLPVLEYRLSRSRLGPGERADGVAVFRRPPYKQSDEILLLEVADAGAVDRPALAPIGFGVNTSEGVENGARE